MASRESSGAKERGWSLLGALVPDCGTAIEMAERGAERPLRIGERFRLFYNSGLCPHCRCARRKFGQAREKMREAEARRAREG